jgi:uncharacterized membrane protein YqhA
MTVISSADCALETDWPIYAIAIEDRASRNSQMSHDPDHNAEYPAEAPANETVTTTDRQVPKIRFIFLLAVISTYIASFVLLLAGAVETLHIVLEVLPPGHALPLSEAKVHFLEVIDQFLMATILYVIGSGLYQLFIHPGLQVESWLKVRSVGDLERKLIGVLIVVLGVTALGRVVIWDGQTNLLPYGVTVAALIIALAYFAIHSKH